MLRLLLERELVLSSNVRGPAIPVSGHFWASLELLLHTRHPGWKGGSERLFIHLFVHLLTYFVNNC